jgi:hypothetical protein
VWPNAAALDTALPTPPSQVHIMLRYKPDWVPVPGDGPRFPEYPELSIADWHVQHGLAGRSGRARVKPARAVRAKPARAKRVESARAKRAKPVRRRRKTRRTAS